MDRRVPRRDPADPDRGLARSRVRSIARRYLPSLGYSGLNALRIFGAVVVANSIAGGVVAFTVALAFFQLPIAVGARPVSTAMLPQLARKFHARRLTDFVEELSKGLGLVLFVVVPSAVFYIALSEQLGHAVFAGDGDEGLGAALFAATIVALAPGILAESGFVLFTTASYAMGDARSPFHAMVTRTVLSVGGMAVALALDPDARARVPRRRAHARELRQRVAAPTLAPGEPRAAHPRGPRRAPRSRRVGAHGVAAYLAAAAVLTASGEAAEIAAVLVAALVGFVVFIAAQRLFRAPELVLVSAGGASLSGGERDTSRLVSSSARSPRAPRRRAGGRSPTCRPRTGFVSSGRGPTSGGARGRRPGSTRCCGTPPPRCPSIGPGSARSTRCRSRTCRWSTRRPSANGRRSSAPTTGATCLTR